MKCRRMLLRPRLRMIGLGGRRLTSWRRSRSSSSKYSIWRAGWEPIRSSRKKRKSNSRSVLKRSMMPRIVSFYSNRSTMKTHLSSLMFWEWTTKTVTMSRRDLLKARDKSKQRTPIMLPTGRDLDHQFLLSLTQYIRAAIMLPGKSLR